ncbi:MAG TPA: glycoside hydrolase family 2 TIM barrel-domain containing protein [Glaciibacter sp.]|nr:glycoside hydrolase family 2 TIM barrel-domain containing protein [Glaciibacter sp.]
MQSTTRAAVASTMAMPASEQDGSYPRPQLMRAQHLNLDGEWGFAYDEEDRGIADHWELNEDVFDRSIRVPFAPEAAASGIEDTGFHSIVWYRRNLDASDLEAAGFPAQGSSLLIHLGAVDYVADVWVDGTHVGRHEGGQTSFSFDVTHAIASDRDNHSIVVRAQDDPFDITTPRGKQDWQHEPHSIWYHRTTGIWRTVWMEAVPALHVSRLTWTPDISRAIIRADIELNARPREAVSLTVTAKHGGVLLGQVTTHVDSDHVSIELSLTHQQNGQAYEELLWSPSTPRLMDGTIELHSNVATADRIESYFGLRSAAVAGGRFLLNDRPFFVRSVLQQGYWPESHYTPPSNDAMRQEVELIQRLGFNSIRIHQKVEDPRFLYWCDRLGLTVWGETAGAYEFHPKAVEKLTREWTEIVRQYASHPSIITWVPFNESWGLQHIAHDPAQRAFSLALTNLTKALDSTRPVISNDGWEHTDSDIWTIHDYESSGKILTERYASRDAINQMIRGLGPAGRRMSVLPPSVGEDTRPVMLTEFGGVSFDLGSDLSDSWGYSVATGTADFHQRLATIMGAINHSSQLAGFCYTQLTDTRQETNGLCDENRQPKLPEAVIAALMKGTELPNPVPDKQSTDDEILDITPTLTGPTAIEPATV